jgi:competence protein ComER
MNIGIIGLGRLGSALARGLDRAGCPDPLFGYNRNSEKGESVRAQAKSLKLCGSEGDIFSQCGLVFLWTKPKDAEAVLELNKAAIGEHNPFIVGCTVGIPFAGYTDRWAECLPNVNMPTGKGVTLIAHRPEITEHDRDLLLQVLGLVGSVYEVPAAELVYYSALASCGPALYVTMTEMLADVFSAHQGYDRALCRRMVRETVAGTMALQELDGLDAAGLVHRVAHPGGPSEAGVRHLSALLPQAYPEMFKAMKKWRAEG